MTDYKGDVLDAAHQVIVLAFDLVESQAMLLPTEIAGALQSPPVQESIKKTLLDFAGTRAPSANTVASREEADKLLASLRSGIQDAASQDVLNQIKKTPEFRRLQASVEAFKKAADSSALGVWVDRHKKILYVVGAALVVGTSTALYVTKTSGRFVNMAVDPLKGKDFEVLQIGTLKFKAGMWDFQPDARVLGARVSATKEWEQITLELKFGILAEGATLKQAEGAAIVKSGPFDVALSGASAPATQRVNLGLQAGYHGVVGHGELNLSIGAMYQDHQLGGTVGASYKAKAATFGLQGTVGQQKGGGVKYGGMFTVTIPL